MTLPRVINITTLPQDEEQIRLGTITYRCYIDNTWVNIEGMKRWQDEEPEKFIRLITEAYEVNKG